MTRVGWWAIGQVRLEESMVGSWLEVSWTVQVYRSSVRLAVYR